MNPSSLLFLAGVSAMLGGALRVSAAFVPWQPESAGLEAFYFVIDVLLLFGLLGIYLRFAPRLGAAGAVGFALALVGLASIVGPDPIAFSIDVYAAGSALLAVGLAVMAVPMIRRRAGPTWIPALWLATPVCAVAGGAVGLGDEGFLLAGLAFGAAFFGAGADLVRPSFRTATAAIGATLAVGVLAAVVPLLVPASAADGAEIGGSAMQPPRLDLNQVTLPALDLDQSIDFYTRFGLDLIVNSPENQYARFEVPGSNATLSIQVQAGRVRAPAVHVYFETATPEEAVARLREAGIEPVEPLEEKPWLWREALYRDPAGNGLYVYFAGENRKNPPWRVSR